MKSQHSGWMSNQSKKPAPQSHMASNTGMTLRPNGVREYSVLGGKYERQGDYLIPCLTVPAEEEQPIGIRGQRHLDYLKQYRKVTYTNLLTSGRLNTYLADIDRQAQERFERLIEGMKQAQGERLKAGNALEWVGRMNNVRACAREIVNEEIIYA